MIRVALLFAALAAGLQRPETARASERLTAAQVERDQIACVTLPESGVAVDIPLVSWMPRHSEPDGGIDPDIEVAHRFREIAAGVDPEMRALGRAGVHGPASVSGRASPVRGDSPRGR